MGFGSFGSRWVRLLTKSSLQYCHGCGTTVALAHRHEKDIYLSAGLRGVRNSLERWVTRLRQNTLDVKHTNAQWDAM